jgi:uncharacterized protein (TIGR02118 family)
MLPPSEPFSMAAAGDPLVGTFSAGGCLVPAIRAVAWTRCTGLGTTLDRRGEMLRVSVFYPNTEGGTFDMEYFLRQHLPSVDKAWGAALIRKEIDAGLSGPGPGTPPTYVAVAHLYFDSIESFQAALGPQHKELEKDARNFTDIKPTIQVSKIVLG